MSEALDRRVFLVIAPPGYGKTTSAAEFTRQLEVLTVWVTLEQSLSDPARLCWALTEGIRAQRKNFGRRLGTSLQSYADDPRGLGSVFVEDLAALREPLVMVLDDFHALQDTSAAGYGVQDFMWSLMTHPQLDHVHLIVTSRSLPNMRLTRLKLAGQLDAVDQDTLAFSVDEVRQYLELVRGAPVSLVEAERNWAGTGGWIAGVVLSEATGSPRAADSVLRPDATFRYLDEEVMPALDGETRDFVTGAAALTEFSASLCDFAMARSDSERRLQELEQRNLFLQRLSPDGRAPLLRFHALFRDYLLSRLDSRRGKSIKARAAQYYLSRGEWLRAAGYLHEAEAWPDLQQLLEEHGQALVEGGRHATVRNLLEDVRSQLPFSDHLNLLHAETLIRASEPDLAEEALASVGDGVGAARAEMAILRARAARISGRNEEAVRIAEEELARRQCSVRQEAMLHRIAGLAWTFLSDQQRGAEHHRQALAGFDALHDFVEAGYSKSDLGILDTHHGNYSRAERLFREALRAFRTHGRSDYLPMAINNLASVLNLVSRHREALELLTEAQGIVEHSGDTYWRAEVWHTLGETHRALGDKERAVADFRESARSAWDAGAVYREQSANLWLSLVLAETGAMAEAMSLRATVREQSASSAWISLLDDLVSLRIAWLNDAEGCFDLAGGLVRRSRQLGQKRLESFGCLFAMGALARALAPNVELGPWCRAFAASVSSVEDALRLFPDVYEAALPGLARLAPKRELAVMDRVWTRLLAERTAQRSAPEVAAQAPRRPARLEVDALRPALRVSIDGHIHTGGWHSSLDLFLYLVHFPPGGVAIDVASALWGDTMTSDRALQQRFQSRVAFLRRILGADAIVREGSARPGSYRLHPDIEIDYDVRRFIEIAAGILRMPAVPDQLEALRAVRSLRRDEYWPARSMSGAWQQDIADEVERTYFALLSREAMIVEHNHLPDADDVQSLLREVTARTGIGLRLSLERDAIAG